MRARWWLAVGLIVAEGSALAFKVDFSPKGVEKNVRQARAVFSEPMVAFGDPSGKEPFAVSCPKLGKGLWEDPRTWIFQFEKELAAGERCAFNGKAEVKSQTGGNWEGGRNFEISGGAPVVKGTRPWDGNGGVEEGQAFVLFLDGPVDPASLSKSVYFRVEGIPEKIPAKLLPAPQREAILSSLDRDYDEDDSPAATKLRNERAVVLQATRPFPAGRKIQLVWGAGVRSANGLVSTTEQAFHFTVRNPFTATLNCGRENADAPCLPIADISLSFSEDIALADAAKIRVHQSGKSFDAKLGKEERVSSVTFSPPFAPNADFRVEVPAGLKDDSGRSLSNAGKFPLKSRTAGYPPLAKFAAPFGVIEAQDAVLPVTLRNVEASLPGSRIVGNSVKLDDRDPKALLAMVREVRNRHDSYYDFKGDQIKDLRGDSLLKARGGQGWTLPKPGGSQPFEVVGIPLKEKGLHVVELQSQLLGKSLLGKPAPMYVAAAALVTDLAVHFKWGKENSLVFVTNLSSGESVSGASLRILDCAGKQLWQGKTGRDGVALAEKIPAVNDAPSCPGGTSELIVLARKGDDFSLTTTSWNDGIEPWRFRVNFDPHGDENIAHTVFDRTLLRAGQTVHMKHFLRAGFMRGMTAAKAFPKSMVLQHASGQKVVVPLKFDANGAAETEWKIPETAKLGTYEVYLTSKDVKAAKPAASHAAALTPETEAVPDDNYESFYGKGNYRVGDFRVEEFRLPVLSGALQFAQGELIAAKEVVADLSVRFLNGGGASGLPVTFRARANEAGSLALPAFEGFTFANGGVKLGRQSRQSPRTDTELEVEPRKLDDAGNARITVAGVPARPVPLSVQLEAEYRDPNGAIQTVSRSVRVFPAKKMVGVRTGGWLAKQDKVKFEVAVASPEGKPLAKEEVKVAWVESHSYSHRKRLVGGFYAYENYTELKSLGEACRGRTNDKGILACEGAAPASGNLLLVAEADGGNAVAKGDIWVSGNDETWFAAENNDRIDVLAEKTHYESGDKARLQVRMPFREATALVTVEREGVLDHYVQTLRAKDPVVEIPVKAEYAPNVFVSIFLVRGRVGEPAPTALLDLAKPAHKMGIAEVKVGWLPHELKVSVETDRDEFKVREKARVKVKVKRADGGTPKKGEALVMAVDEALLELRKNDTWNLLAGMMGERPLRVATSTVQGQVIGKRHFGLKALPAGGGGGVSSARELFDTLLYWKAVVPLDGSGEATVEVPMNDSLSSFRIVAIATEGADRFGTGEKSVRTRQDLMLFAGVSPFGREGDRTRPSVTVRNGAASALEAEVRAKVSNGVTLKPQKVKLNAGASQALFWDYEIPSGQPSLTYEFEAAAGDARDQVKFVQKVDPPYVPTILQSTLERLDHAISLAADVPKNAFPGTASLEVRVEAKLGSNLAGVKAYMNAYPYACLEQKFSKLVSAQDEKAWRALAKTLPQYMDGSGLLKYFPEMREGSDVLTSYLLSVAEAGGYPLPESILPTVLGGLKSFVEGNLPPAGFVYPAADLAIRKLAAIDALSRYQTFDAAWLTTLHLEPSLLPLGALVDYRGILAREMAIPEREKILAKVDQAIRTRIAYRGTILGFGKESAENLWWLMGSADSAAVKLLHAVAEDKAWAADVGRLVRGVLARQQRGHWDLTTANAWGTVAMQRYSKAFEAEAVTGLTKVSAGGKSQELDIAKGKVDATFPLTGATKLEAKHEGGGKPWAFLSARAALELKAPVEKGYRLKRSVGVVSQKKKGAWSVGDVYRVTLEVDASSDMTWVAISDPIPGGASLLGTGLGGDSASLTRGEESQGAWPTYEEKSFGGYRAYYQWLPKGTTKLEYTVRLNTAGRFRLPNTRVEAMYAPEMYAEAGNGAIEVAE